MKCIQSSLVRTLITILLSGAIILTQKLYRDSSNSQTFDNDGHNPLIILNNHQDPINYLGLQETIEEASSNYLVFMMLALFIDTIIKQLHLQKIKQYLSKESPNNEYFESFTLKGLVRAILRYTLNFWLLHFFWFTACYIFYEKISSQNLLNINSIHLRENSNLKTARILSEEEAKENIYEKIQNKDDDQTIISLSIGKVISSFDMITHAIIFSKDSNTAFTIVTGSSAKIFLQIFNVTNFQDLVLISSLEISDRYTSTTYTGLLLSQDEKTLYSFNLEWFDIINVSNLKQPVRIIDYQYDDRRFDPTSSGFNFPVGLFDDGQVVFIGRKDLHVYYIAETYPQVVDFTLKDDESEDEHLVTSLVMGAHGILYLTYGGALRAYNMSDIDDITLVQSYSIEDELLEWISLSKDKKTAFVLSSKKEGRGVTLRFMNVSDSGSFQSIEAYDLNLTSISSMILAISPSESQLFIGYYDYDAKLVPLRKVAVWNLKQKTLWKSEQSLLPTTKSFVFQSNKRIFEIQAPKSELRIIEFYSPFPNKQLSSLSNNLVTTFPTSSTGKMTLSSNEKYLITSGISATHFEIWNMSNITSPTQVKSINLNDFPKFIQVSDDNTKLFIVAFRNNYIYDISDLTSQTTPEIGFYGNNRSIYGPEAMVVTQDTNYQYILSRHFMEYRIILTNLTNLSSIYDSVTIDLKSRYVPEGVALFLTKEQNILFVVTPLENGDVSIYNVSNRSTFEFISSFKIRGKNFSFSALSHDDKTFFIETIDDQNHYHLEIFDVSNLSKPIFMSSFPLPTPVKTQRARLMVSLDSKTIYLPHRDKMFLIDVSDLKAPRVAGLISIPDSKVPYYVISQNQEYAYITHSREISVVNLRIKYTLFFEREQFLLGKKYTEQLRLLDFNQNFKMYDLMESKSFKIIKTSLLSINPNKTEEYSVSFASLPYWMTLDKENLILTIEPQHENTIGTYTLCSGFSKKISQDVFVNSGLFQNVQESEALIMILVTYGYLDNRYFLTSSLTTVDDFMLPQQYASNKNRIFEILKEYYFEPCTQFELIPSLNVSSSHNKIFINTPSSSSIKLDLKLGDNQTHTPAKFLLQSYKDLQSKIIEENSRLILEGSLKEIEAALRKLVINLENDDEPCDGRVIVSDNLNPQVTKEIQGISHYFMKNEAPIENEHKTVKDQIEAKKFETGQSFTILFEDITFYDKYSTYLTYELHFFKNGVKEKLPSWISFNNLFMNGIPPEELFERDFNFELVAKNEFRSKRVPFTIHAKISLIFALKLAAKYCPYILTIIGLVVYANRMYNILLKPRYKHAKQYYLHAGQKITNNILYPIIFVSEEKRESELIFKMLRKLVADEFGKKSITSSELASYFMSQDRSLNKDKLLLKVQEAANSLSDKQQLKIYPLEGSFARQVLNQILINKMSMMCLDLPNEKITKKAYQGIKDLWIDIVDWQEDPAGLMINQNKFYHLLQSKGIQTMQTASCSSFIESSEKDNQISLINNDSEMNLKLLQDAVLAYAFDNHHIDYFAASVQVNMKHKVKKNFLSQFLKRDLRNIYNSPKDKRGFGVKCKIKNEVLYFSGVTDEKFDGKTFVIQIVNGKERILKEIWIYGTKINNIEIAHNDTIL